MHQLKVLVHGLESKLPEILVVSLKSALAVVLNVFLFMVEDINAVLQMLSLLGGIAVSIYTVLYLRRKTKAISQQKPKHDADRD